jgi:hypothetical protein
MRSSRAGLKCKKSHRLSPSKAATTSGLKSFTLRRTLSGFRMAPWYTMDRRTAASNLLESPKPGGLGWLRGYGPRGLAARLRSGPFRLLSGEKSNDRARAKRHRHNGRAHPSHSGKPGDEPAAANALTILHFPRVLPVTGNWVVWAESQARRSLGPRWPKMWPTDPGGQVTLRSGQRHKSRSARLFCACPCRKWRKKDSAAVRRARVAM